MISVIINGKREEFADNISILAALRVTGTQIPALCQDDRLKPLGTCGLCAVEVEGVSHLVHACMTSIQEGMAIRSHTPGIEQSRKLFLKLLACRIPLSAVKQRPDTEFLRWLKHYELEDQLAEHVEAAYTDDAHPYLHVDMSLCIRCYRCVRICADIQGEAVWRALNRSDDVKLIPGSGGPLLDSACVSCGACADTCPTGAIIDKDLLSRTTPSEWTRTTCPYCGVGCEMNIGTSKGQIVTVRPVLEAPVNKGHLCVKGRYAFKFADSDDRITQPMIRQGNDWSPVSWEEALHFTSQALHRISRTYGPDSIGLLGSARATNEENYLIQKFARTVLRTNNVDCCARVCHAPTAAAMNFVLGTGAATNSFADIENARTFLVCGANATESHPIVGARIRQAVFHGAGLIVIDPRRTDLARIADVHLQLHPGTDIPLLNAIASTLVEEGLCDETFLAERVEGWTHYRTFIESWTPERVTCVTGVPADLIRQSARLYANRKPAMAFHGLGVTEQEQGTEAVMCLVNLALLTGSFGKPGCGVNPLRGQNNVQGAAHMGCEPAHLTGYVALDDDVERFEQAWGTQIPRTRGRDLLQMMDAARQGSLKALWVTGYDIFLTNANAVRTRDALSSLEFMIIEDLFMNETARNFGSVFLPAASGFEKEGTFMNAERRIQRIRKAIEPRGQSKPDWEIICLLAQEMGSGHLFDFCSAEQIWDEVRKVWKAGAGISYQRIERTGIQWPCPSDEDPGTSILHVSTFSKNARAALQCVGYIGSSENTNADYPFVLITGRSIYQFNAGTMTMRTRNRDLRPLDYLDVSAIDALHLKLTEGDRVRVVSAHGEIALPVRISSELQPGVLFTTFHVPELFVNQVTGPWRDSLTNTPAYKRTAVRIDLPG